MRKSSMRRKASIASFGMPEKEVIDRVIRIPGQFNVKKKKRSGCRMACCIILFTILAIVGALSIAVAVVEFTSKPGYLKSSQDTNNAETMAKIQQVRPRMPDLVTRFSTGHPKLTKQEIVDHIQRATAFSSAVYGAEYNPKACPFPVQANLSRVITTSHATAMIARDDVAQQIVISYKGLSGPMDYLRILKTEMQPLQLANVVIDQSVKVHKYSQEAFSSLEQPVLDTVMSELSRSNTTYSILVTGHNTGGSLAVITGLELKAMLPNNLVLVVTQGQPRSFNQAGADLVDSTFPAESQSLFRATHMLDGLPTIKRMIVSSDARHHAGEIWQFADPAIPENIVLCVKQEDPSCSEANASPVAQIVPPATFYNAESIHYFDIELNSKTSKQCEGNGGQFQYSLLTSRSNGKLAASPTQEAIDRV